MAKLGISLPDDLYQKLEALADERKKTVSGLIAEAIQAYFFTEKKPQPQSPVPAPQPSAPTSPAPSANKVPHTQPSGDGHGQDVTAKLILDRIVKMENNVNQLSLKFDDLSAAQQVLLDNVHELSNNYIELLKVVMQRGLA